MKSIKENLAAELVRFTFEEGIDGRMDGIGIVFDSPTCYSTPTDIYCMFDLVRLAKFVGKGRRYNSVIHTGMEHYRFTATMNMNKNLLMNQLTWGTSIYGAWLDITPDFTNSINNLVEPITVTSAEDWLQVWEALEEHLFLGHPDLLKKFRDEKKVLPEWEFYNELYEAMDTEGK